MAVTLVVSMVGREPQTITLDLPRIVIGRASHADVRLPSRSVSELHAVLHKNGNELSILDEQSSNGTRVNGAALPRGRRKVLADGDVIAIAPYALRVTQVVARPDPPERTASLARRLLHDALSSSGGEAAPPRLVLMTGKQAGLAWVLPPAPGRVLVGRDAGCEVCLDERDCSRQHAEVVREADGTTIRDLASKNGLVVGGRAVNERRLRHGDEVTIGKTTLRYHDPVEELLRSLESGADEPPPEPPPEPEAPPALASPALAVASPAPAPAVASPTPAVAPPEASAPPAPAAPTGPAAVSAGLAAAASRGTFDWIVVVLAVIVLVVSVGALVMLLQGHR
ncbi:MAG: FHA domain-containing protein [Polyangiales bacterium]